MKYISIQDLLDYGKELRFQSAEQMAKVYDELPSITIIHCKDCKHGAFDAWVKTYWCKGKQHLADWFCADGCLPEIMTPPTGETNEKEK